MTKKESKEVRKSTIIEAAINEFVENGYENTSMNSIAARAGLTKGGLYYHFKSKDDILIEAKESFMKPVYKMMHAAINTPIASEGIFLYIKDYLTYWTQHPRELSFVFLIYTKIISNKIDSSSRGFRSQLVSFFAGLYQKGIDNHELESFDVKSLAFVLMGALNGVIGFLVLDKNIILEESINDFKEVFINQFLKK
jgi:AcrR family transcriptional regulator